MHARRRGRQPSQTREREPGRRSPLAHPPAPCSASRQRSGQALRYGGAGCRRPAAGAGARRPSRQVHPAGTPGGQREPHGNQRRTSEGERNGIVSRAALHAPCPPRPSLPPSAAKAHGAQGPRPEALCAAVAASWPDTAAPHIPLPLPPPSAAHIHRWVQHLRQRHHSVPLEGWGVPPIRHISVPPPVQMGAKVAAGELAQQLVPVRARSAAAARPTSQPGCTAQCGFQRRQKARELRLLLAPAPLAGLSQPLLAQRRTGPRPAACSVPHR